MEAVEQRRSAGAARELVHAPEWVILAIACLGQFMVVLDVSVVNVAIPSIHRDLGLSASGLQWVVNAYTLAFAGLLLLAGRLGDLAGRRRIFLVGLAGFTGASLVCGLAQDQAMVIAARALQGLSAAVLAPATLTIIQTAITEPRARARAMGIWSAVGALGGSVGVILGGVLTEELSWRWIFFINIPIGIATLVVGRLVLSESRSANRTRLDVPGSVLATAGLTALVYGVVESASSGWASASTLGTLAGALVLLGAFVAYEARIAPAPIMPLRLFRSRAIAGSNLVMLGVASVMFALWFMMSLYLQQVRGFSPIRTGTIFVVFTVGIIVGTQSSSRLVHRFGSRRLLALGAAALITSFFLFSRLTPTSSVPLDVMLPGFLTGFGLGFSLTPITFSATTGVARHEAGIASGLVNTSRQVGGSIGLAVLVTLANEHSAHLLARGVSAAAAASSGYAFSFRVGAIASFATLAATLVLPPRRRASAEAAPSPAPAISGRTASSQL